MKNYVFRILAFMTSFFFTIEESMTQGPITPTNGLVGKSEIAVIWENSGSEPSGNVTYTHHHLGLKTDYENIDYLPDRLENTISDTLGVNYGNRTINGVAGDFDGDSRDEYLIISKGQADSLYLDLALPGESGVKEFNRTLLTGGPVSVANQVHMDNVYAASADLNQDGSQELILSWVSPADSLVILVLALENKQFKSLQRMVEEEVISGVEKDILGIHATDIDMNGDPELGVLFYSEQPTAGLYLSLYSFGNTPALTPLMKDRYLFDPAIAVDYMNQDIDFFVNLSSGDYNGDGKKEFLALLIPHYEPSEIVFFPLQVGDDPSTPEVDPLESISMNVEDIDRNEIGYNSEYPDMVSGDVNGDGKDDLLLAYADIEVFHTGEEDRFDFRNEYVTWVYGNQISFISLANVDNNPDNGLEIIYAVNISEDINLYLVDSDPEFNFTDIAFKNLDTWGKGLNSHVMITADFDGDMFRIGPGKKYNRTDVVQPLVILNAPPTHFDRFGDNTYDVNNCHDGGECSSFATYTSVSSEQISVSTTLNKSWGVSSTISAGGNILGASVSGYLTGEYGENFEKTSSETQTVVVSQQVTATYDDQIYATVCDYEVWEYPVYNQNGVLKGNILTLDPTLSENRWFPSKERSAAGYVPKHEVGNILSYTPYTDLINPDGEDKIRGSYGSDSYDLDADTDVNFNVNLSNTFNDTEVQGRRIGVEAGGSVSGWGIEVSASGRYDESQLSTHSVSVGKGLDITVHLGGVNRSIGETGYNVTPYIYWAKNGALVVDYAVRPILPEPGGTETWWSENYDQPDPSFILPWRLDPEKGLVLQDEVKRKQTKSISFSPSEPETGDTVLVRAYVHNFSPYPTAGEIPVSFYIGDPEASGILIGDIHGETVFYTNGIIDAQAFGEVSFRWVIPKGLPSFPRIYGVINPGGGMNEVHTSNNTGWAILGKADAEGPVSVEDRIVAGKENRVFTYPNPVTDILNFRMSMERTVEVQIEILDLRGKVLVKKIYPADGAEFSEYQIPVQELGTGMYLYRVNSGNYFETGKFFKVKK